MDRPDVQGRIAILKVHSRGKTLSSDVDFDKIARRTPGEPCMWGAPWVKWVALIGMVGGTFDCELHLHLSTKAHLLIVGY